MSNPRLRNSSNTVANHTNNNPSINNNSENDNSIDAMLEQQMQKKLSKREKRRLNKSKGSGGEQQQQNQLDDDDNNNNNNSSFADDQPKQGQPYKLGDITDDDSDNHQQPQAKQQSQSSTSGRLQEIDLNLMDESGGSNDDDSFSFSPPTFSIPNNTTATNNNNNNNNKSVSNNTKVKSSVSSAAIAADQPPPVTSSYSSNAIQKLDQAAAQKLLVVEQAVLIINEKEELLVNSDAEFISLFKSSRAANSSTTTSSIFDDDSDDVTDFSKQIPNHHNHNHYGRQTSQQRLPTAASVLANDDKFVKCVAIFGNTGDGKSHTLNHTFFNGRQIFRTSSKQETCTMGVWCAYDPVTHALVLDTEGLLGTTSNENERMRLLLKVLAISDIVIYRSRAERLHSDIFKFLSEASAAYTKFFKAELKSASQRLRVSSTGDLGPSVVLFHETQHTMPLCDEKNRSMRAQINERFAQLELAYEAYSLIEYVGTRTPPGASTDFQRLSGMLREMLKNNSVRTPRKLSSIYNVLKALNEKFNGEISRTSQMATFADEYFTCSSVCLACAKRCECSINHLRDGVLHYCKDACRYDHQYDNKVYICRECFKDGKKEVIIPKTSASTENSLVGIVKYALSGFVLECPRHGIIYRSRQYWYGNREPESVVCTEIKHIWCDQKNDVGTSHNLSRKIIDSVSYLGDTLHSVTAQPTKVAMQWMADKVAPSYWTPNYEISDCTKCRKKFSELLEKKHHCRGCGKGFCDKCSAKRRVIPWWSPSDKVRVCDECFAKKIIPEPVPPPTMVPQPYPLPALPSSSSTTSSSNNDVNDSSGSNSSLSSLQQPPAFSANQDVMARKVTETVQGTIGIIGYATKLPIDMIKESARPSYWTPDADCVNCALCKKKFEDLLPLHHCRSCGKGVCQNCSPSTRAVPSRGWETPVRVCKECEKVLT